MMVPLLLALLPLGLQGALDAQRALEVHRVLDAAARAQALVAFARMALVLTGLLLFWIGLFAALSRRRLDVLATGLFVAGLGIALLAAGLGALAGAPRVGITVARSAMALATAQAVSGLALARLVGARLSATRTDQLQRLHG